MRRSITLAALVALVVGAVAVGLVALLGGGGGDSDSATAAKAGSGLVSMQSVDGTDVLVDSEGRTLYSADVEKGGRMRCTGACESFWDPIEASASEAKAASADLDLKLGVVKRPSGDRQLTRDGRPLYRFKEEGPGQLKGDGFVDDFQGTHFEWQAAAANGGSRSGSSGAPSDSSPY